MAVTKETVIIETDDIEDLLTNGRNPADRYSKVELITRADTKYPRGGGLRISKICSEQVEEDGQTYREYKAHLAGDPSPGHRLFTVHAISRLKVTQIYATKAKDGDTPLRTTLEIKLKTVKEQKQQTGQMIEHEYKNRRNGNGRDHTERYTEEAK